MAVKDPGDTVMIPVTAQPGPFSRECLVQFESTDGPVSGFVPSRSVITKDEAQYIEATVVSVNGQSIAVRLNGSFFTTTGTAHIAIAA